MSDSSVTIESEKYRQSPSDRQWEMPQVYGFTDLDASQPDAWRYLVEVQDPGKPADVTGYR